jgi:FkbM family methyltransferase
MNAVSEVLSRFFPGAPPTWFLDVGVGQGREAWDAKELWPDVKVIGFDPFADAETNDYPGVLHDYGCWSYPRQIDITVEGDNSTCFPNAWDKVPMKAVEVRPLDELILGDPHSIRLDVRNAVLWIDTEGAELEVLRGAWELLRQGRISLVNAELRREPKFPSACCAADVDAFMAAFGFARVLDYNTHKGDDPHWDSVYCEAGRERS